VTPEREGGEEDFLSRWSRRKQAAAKGELPEQDADPAAAAPLPDTEPEPPVLTDADMPPVESLGDDDDYSGFLSPGVSETLRQAALRRLFQAGKYNLTDGLDDYAEDYTSFKPLGNVLTADLRHQLERVARQLAGDEEGVAAGLLQRDPVASTSPAQSEGAERLEPRPDASRQSPGDDGVESGEERV